MKTYTVTWQIELDAESALEAAREAWSTMLDPDSLPPAFEVQEEGAEQSESVDLCDYEL